MTTDDMIVYAGGATSRIPPQNGAPKYTHVTIDMGEIYETKFNLLGHVDQGNGHKFAVYGEIRNA